MAHTRRASVLIVEDDPATASMLAEVLDAEGFRVSVARDGSEALERVTVAVPDAIVLDLLLPGVGGVEVLGRLRACPEGRRVPVIVVTAAVDQDLTWAAWRAGCDAFFTKPIDPGDLVETLHRHVGGFAAIR